MKCFQLRLAFETHNNNNNKKDTGFYFVEQDENKKMCVEVSSLVDFSGSP
jgi:hypothetical protein